LTLISSVYHATVQRAKRLSRRAARSQKEHAWGAYPTHVLFMENGMWNRAHRLDA
jgi:hypothetical protein